MMAPPHKGIVMWSFGAPFNVIVIVILILFELPVIWDTLILKERHAMF